MLVTYIIPDDLYAKFIVTVAKIKVFFSMTSHNMEASLDDTNGVIDELLGKWN